MWCKNCNLEVIDETCPVCGAATEEDVPAEIFWCDTCGLPVITPHSAADKGICPLCSGKMRYLVADIRPVFPEERLLLAALLDKPSDFFMNRSVWALNSKYYIDGKAVSVSAKTFAEADRRLRCRENFCRCQCDKLRKMREVSA